VVVVYFAKQETQQALIHYERAMTLKAYPLHLMQWMSMVLKKRQQVHHLAHLLDGV
jgi:hypothetical protein